MPSLYDRDGFRRVLEDVGFVPRLEGVAGAFRNAIYDGYDAGASYNIEPETPEYQTPLMRAL